MNALRIGGIDYVVTEFDGDFDDGLMGRENYKVGKIYINKSLPDSKKRETLLHEIMHIVYANTGLREGDDEERIVTAMSCGVYQALVDNFKTIDNL